MKTENNNEVNVTIEGSLPELTIREGQAAQLISKIPVTITGIINTVLEYLTKRKPYIDFSKANLQVNREGLNMVLTLNENESVFDKITGKLSKTEEFINFGINTGKSWVSRQLGEFVKMNRTYFESRETANDLAAKLLTFKANVETKEEKRDDNRGNALNYREKIIREINIPEKITIEIPIFKGSKKSKIVVELYINSEDLSITLVSPDAADIIRTVRDEIIDAELKEIRELCPALAIIEI